MGQSAEVIRQILFWPAVDDYLIMDPEVRKNLETFVKFDQDVARDGHAELINLSHAFVQVPPEKTALAITSVLVKVVEYAAKVKEKGHTLHVGCVCVSRRPDVVDTSRGKMRMVRENVFVPVKVV